MIISDGNKEKKKVLKNRRTVAMWECMCVRKQNRKLKLILSVQFQVIYTKMHENRKSPGGPVIRTL